MAHGTYRSAALWQNIWDMLTKRYYGELGAGVADISKGLWEQQLPIFEEMIGDYYGGAAGLGQMVPGQGGSSAAQRGLENLMGDYMANITQTALGAWQMPWQTHFGSAYTPAEIGSQMHAVKSAQQQMRYQLGSDIAQGGGQMMGQWCCFIFIEADNGILDRIARRYRDEYGTEEQKTGYKRMASWLVPLMREYKVVKDLVKWTMVKPMIAWGKAFYGENKWGHIFWPVAKGWLKIFEIGGR